MANTASENKSKIIVSKPLNLGSTKGTSDLGSSANKYIKYYPRKGNVPQAYDKPPLLFTYARKKKKPSLGDK